MVVRKVTLLHKVVSTMAGKPTTYQDISIPLFSQGYMIILEGEQEAIKLRMASHLKEII